MNKSFVIWSILLGVLVISGCTQPSPGTVTPEEAQTLPATQQYESATDGFAIDYPSDRTFQEHVYNTSVMFFSPLTAWDTIKENVSITKTALNKPYTLEEYYTITKSDLAALKPWFTEVSNSIITVDGKEFQQLIYTGMSNDIQLKWQQMSYIHEQSIYVITYTATAATFDEYLDQVNDMIATLDITE